VASGWGREITWKSIEITNEVNGMPIVSFNGDLKNFISDDKEIKISLSHSDNYVAAVAIVYKNHL
jgi:phosphopantetheinyl transferase (holo-ACP synthase)